MFQSPPTRSYMGKSPFSYGFPMVFHDIGLIHGAPPAHPPWGRDRFFKPWEKKSLCPKVWIPKICAVSNKEKLTRRQKKRGYMMIWCIYIYIYGIYIYIYGVYIYIYIYVWDIYIYIYIYIYINILYIYMSIYIYI